MVARATFGATAVAAIVGIVVALAVAADGQGASHFDTAMARLLNQLAYFTVQSNIFVAVGCALLAVGVASSATWFVVLRLVGLIDIAVTGVVYHLLLAQSHVTVAATAADALLHTVVPIAAVGGWLMFGPRSAPTWAMLGCALLVPIAWLAVTLVRGAIIDWYPYPFLDVSEHGYGTVLANLVGVSAFFLVVGAAVVLLSSRVGKPDELRPGRHAASTS